MGTFEIRFQVNGQYCNTLIKAATVGSAISILRAQSHGCYLNICWASEVR